MTNQRLEYLLECLNNKTLTPGQWQELSDWYETFDKEEGLTGSMDVHTQVVLRDQLWSNIQGSIAAKTQESHNWQQSQQEDRSPAVIRLLQYGKRNSWLAAALLTGIIAGSALLYTRGSKKTGPDLATHTSVRESIIPGGNKAVLTLSNGRTITLDSATDGILDKEDGTAINKRTDGQLVYEKLSSPDAAIPPSGEAAGEIAYNTLSTPAGGQYQVVLPDGTRVWLNAASSLRYPTVFTGKDRNVLLNGEAYFEVASDIAKPFIVAVAGKASVTVLGTSFNIMAYQDEENIKTTIVDGAVRMDAGSTGTILKKGQQGTFSLSTGDLASNPADVEEAIAWKNGLFQFSSADIHAVMRQLARWYNVKVQYEGQVTEHFTGQAYRNEDISQLLKILELTGKASFAIQGKQITVIGK